MPTVEQWLLYILVVALVFFAIIGLTGFKPVLSVPETYTRTDLPGWFNAIVYNLGFPSEILAWPAFLYFGVIPLLAIWLIIYGFLTEIRIFREKPGINVLLALAIAFSLVPLRLFVIIISILFGFMGMYATGAFIGLFAFGVWYFSRAHVRGWRAYEFERKLGVYWSHRERELKDKERRLLAERNEIDREMKQLRRKKERTDPEERRLKELSRRMDEITAELEIVRRDMREAERRAREER